LALCQYNVNTYCVPG